MFILLIIASLCIFIYVYIISIKNFLNKGIYGYLPIPTIINDYIIALENSDNTEDEKDKQFNDFLLNKYIEIASQNTEVNITRQETIVKIRAMLITNILILTLAFIPYFISSGNNLNSHKIVMLKNNSLHTENTNTNYDKICNKKDLNMSDNTAEEIKFEPRKEAINKPEIIPTPEIRLVSESFEQIPTPQNIRLSMEDNNSKDIITK
jgi:hypothetical protein